jgi:hypothetical protein
MRVIIMIFRLPADKLWQVSQKILPDPVIFLLQIINVYKRDYRFRGNDGRSRIKFAIDEHWGLCKRNILENSAALNKPAQTASLINHFTIFNSQTSHLDSGLV